MWYHGDPVTGTCAVCTSPTVDGVCPYEDPSPEALHHAMDITENGMFVPWAEAIMLHYNAKFQATETREIPDDLVF